VNSENLLSFLPKKRNSHEELRCYGNCLLSVPEEQQYCGGNNFLGIDKINDCISLPIYYQRTKYFKKYHRTESVMTQNSSF
jgi:hypothetical protein